MAGQDDPVLAVPGEHAGSDKLIPAGRRDQDPVLPIRRRALEREEPAESVERRVAGCRVGEGDSVALCWRPSHSPGGITPPSWMSGGITRDQDAVPAVSQKRGLLAPHRRSWPGSWCGRSCPDLEAISPVRCHDVVVRRTVVLDSAPLHHRAIRVQDQIPSLWFPSAALPSAVVPNGSAVRDIAIGLSRDRDPLPCCLMTGCPSGGR